MTGSDRSSDPAALAEGWRSARIAELFEAYGEIELELRARGLARSRNLVGDYAEYLVAKAIGGSLAAGSEKSWDVLVGEKKVQVKARLVGDPIRAGERQMSVFRSFDFDTAVLVLFRKTDFSVLQAVEIPVECVRDAATFRTHVNGHVLHANLALLEHETARDVTDLLNDAALES